MFLSEVINDVRRLVGDDFSPYRVSDFVLLNYLNDGVRDIYNRRPDSKWSNDGSYYGFDTVLYGGAYDYNSSYVNRLDRINGLDLTSNSILYFEVSAGVLYASYNATVIGNEIFSVANILTQTGEHTVTEENASGVSGKMVLPYLLTEGDTFSVEFFGKPLQLDDLFKMPLIYYIAERFYLDEDDDTVDNGRAQQYAQLYLGELING